VTRLVGRQFVRTPANDLTQLGLGERPADAISVKAVVRRVSRPRVPQSTAGLAAQVLVLRALHHAEQRLVAVVRALPGEADMGVQAALRPPLGALHR